MLVSSKFSTCFCFGLTVLSWKFHCHYIHGKWYNLTMQHRRWMSSWWCEQIKAVVCEFMAGWLTNKQHTSINLVWQENVMTTFIFICVTRKKKGNRNKKQKKKLDPRHSLVFFLHFLVFMVCRLSAWQWRFRNFDYFSSEQPKMIKDKTKREIIKSLH